MDRSEASFTRVICTLGMHRSGTSLVSRLLNILGVHLGPDQQVVTRGADNPKGFWEYRPFVDVNDEILARFGGRWDEPPALPPSWPRDPRLADLRETARRLLAADLAPEPLWGWKDPRACLTLPFWQDLVGPMRYVVCVRNPCAVVASLVRRDGMSGEKADRLWLEHMTAILAGTSGQPRMFVFYEDVIDDWRPELQRLAAFIGHRERADDPRVREAVGEFLQREMCHHHMSMEELAGDPRISFPTVGLYVAARGLAREEDGPHDPAPRRDRSRLKALDRFGERVIEARDRTSALAAERDGLAVENQTQAAALASLDGERERLAGDRDRLAAERDRLAAERDRWAAESRALGERAEALLAECAARAADLAVCRQAIAGLESELAAMTRARDAQVGRCETVLAELQSVHASSTWRLATFGREAILPAGTRRRRLVNAILRRFLRRPPPPRPPGTAVDLREPRPRASP